jgi:hypothetical protein
MKVTAINTAPTDIPLELGLRVVGRREARPFQGDLPETSTTTA